MASQENQRPGIVEVILDATVGRLENAFRDAWNEMDRIGPPPDAPVDPEQPKVTRLITFRDEEGREIR